jgi:hypothetical protein
MNNNRRIFILTDSDIIHDRCCISVFNKSRLISFSSINIVDIHLDSPPHSLKKDCCFCFSYYLYFIKEDYFGFKPLLETKSKEYDGINLMLYLLFKITIFFRIGICYP